MEGHGGMTFPLNTARSFMIFPKSFPCSFEGKNVKTGIGHLVQKFFLEIHVIIDFRSNTSGIGGTWWNDFSITKAIPRSFKKKMFKTGIGHLTNFFFRTTWLNYRFSVETLPGYREGHSGMTFPITKLSAQKFQKWKMLKTGISHLTNFFLEKDMIKLSIFLVRTLQVQGGHSREWLFPITKLSPEVSEVKNVENWDRSFDQNFLREIWLNYRFSVRTLQVQGGT